MSNDFLKDEQLMTNLGFEDPALLTDEGAKAICYPDSRYVTPGATVLPNVIGGAVYLSGFRAEEHIVAIGRIVTRFNELRHPQ